MKQQPPAPNPTRRQPALLLASQGLALQSAARARSMQQQQVANLYAWGRKS
jgi:hypothetical protein